MPWTVYSYQAGPPGSLTALSTYCNRVRIYDEGSPGKRGGNVPIQYFHGERAVPHKFSQPALLGLECIIRNTDSSGAITHADGEAGHTFENLSNLKKILYGTTVMTVLQREAPHQGTVQIEVEVGAPVMTSQARHVFLFPLVAPKPFWFSTTLNSSAPTPSIAVGGSAPVDDAEIVFTAGASSPLLTHTSSGLSTAPTIQVTGTIPSGGVRVRTATGHAERITGGTDYSEFLVLSKNFVLDLYPGTQSFTYSGGGSPLIEWRNKWR